MLIKHYISALLLFPYVLSSVNFNFPLLPSRLSHIKARSWGVINGKTGKTGKTGKIGKTAVLPKWGGV